MGDIWTIGEVAARSGFSPSALRFYDDIGLVPPATRSEAGYRLYDDRTIDRLAFVARAKDLGCSIDEIRELIVAWDGGRCGPVQDRLRRLVAEKIDATSTRLSEAEKLLADLRRSAGDLERHRPVGACDASCGCVSSGSSPLSSRLAEPRIDWVTLGQTADISCSLPFGELDDRVGDWQRLLAFAACRETLADGVRVVFETSVPHDELMRLVTAEQSCCTFFEFAITVDRRGVALEVRAAPEAMDVVEALFGERSTDGE